MNAESMKSVHFTVTSRREYSSFPGWPGANPNPRLASPQEASVSLIHNQDLGLGNTTRDDANAIVVTVADARRDDQHDACVLVLQGQAVLIRVQGDVGVVAELDGTLVPGKGEGETGSHHLVADLHGQVRNRVQAQAGLRLDRIGAQEWASDVLEARGVLGRLVCAEAGIIVVGDDSLDDAAHLLLGQTALLGRLADELNHGADGLQDAVGAVIPAKP